MRSYSAIVLFWFIMLLSACGNAPADHTEKRESIAQSDTGVIDWSNRTVSVQDPGWSIAFCEGDGPFLCVSRENRQLGSIELLKTAVSDHAILADVLRGGGSELEALEKAAAEFVATVAADRRIGLGENYELQADPMTPATVMGKPGLRLVVEGRLGDRILERIVHFYAIQRDTSYLLAAVGSDGGGHLGEFTIADLKAFGPALEAIASASRVHPIAP